MIVFFITGGYDRGECLKSVESYCPDSNVWATLAPMKEARGRFDIAVSGGRVYAVGGSNGTTELATVEMFDPKVQKWTRVSSLPLARSNTGEPRILNTTILFPFILNCYYISHKLILSYYMYLIKYYIVYINLLLFEI